MKTLFPLGWLLRHTRAILVDPLLPSTPHTSGCLRVFPTSLCSGVRRLAAARTVPRSKRRFRAKRD
jgi:hypothetical protein